MGGARNHDPISAEVAYRSLRRHPGWVVERDRLRRDFRLASFTAALDFVNAVGELAQRLDHHPNIRIHEWCFVELELYTHAVGSLSSLDVEFATRLDDELGGLVAGAGPEPARDPKARPDKPPAGPGSISGRRAP